MKKRELNGLTSREIKLIRALDEGAKALNRRGVSQTSLTEIAKRLGISRSALYYYFEDQQDLVFQCYRRSCEQLTLRLNEARRRSSGTFEAIEIFIESILNEDQPEFAVLSEPSFLRTDQRSMIFKLYDNLRTNLADILDEGINSKELRPCHSKLVASAIIGLISWITKIHQTRDLSRNDLIKTIKSMLHSGIAADRSAPIHYTPFTLSPMSVPAWQAFDQEVMLAARQEAFLSAASWLFNLKGVDATSLDEIAQRVGVTKKLIYHNIGDKQVLVDQCYRRAYNFYEDIGTRVHAYKGSRIDALSAAAHALAEASMRSDIAPFRPFTGLESQPKAVSKKLRESERHLTSLYLEIYKQGIAEGSLTKVDAGIPAMLLLLPGTVEWLPKWLESFSDADRARAPWELTELYRLGLRPLYP
ncbi:MAG: hypothetical protein COA71_08535 [SAR86 cluster bacterium]|uniref:HTH tetR-type domain-containing protein n=1 Tax=SAR86 cluster bacterium TaxID=2030880 RepID=A0A2A5CC11_9GAMM|nr:TetR/AcrR family transcriptional regulator [Gammaproteobacteria bacterium AH-315-E17]PCJ41085.1 MAG: hypothetical protein COA71_08535 [SAR86 cluster bacterium]